MSETKQIVFGALALAVFGLLALSIAEHYRHKSGSPVAAPTYDKEVVIKCQPHLHVMIGNTFIGKTKNGWFVAHSTDELKELCFKN